MNPSTLFSQERFKARFEAWEAQIYHLLRELPEGLRRTPPVQRLIRQHTAVSRRIADWKGGERDRRRLEGELRGLKREWANVLDVMEIA